MSSKLKFPNLGLLVPDMELKKVDRERFTFIYNGQTIDCIFSFVGKAYESLVGIHDLNYGFVAEVYKNVRCEYVAVIDDEIYIGFCKALNLSYKADGFNSNTLLTLLSKHIPTKSSGTKIRYDEMRRFLPYRAVDESEKIYFKGWNDHVKDGRVARNFDKTEFYLGKEVADYCRRNNISSLWTADSSEEVKVTNPW